MTVRHSRGAYAVEFVPFAEALRRLPEDTIVVTDANVAAHWAAKTASVRGIVTVQPGEASKSLPELERTLERFAALGASRATTVVALGGGVVGDLAGFAAACYMRGVPCVQIPTTLLAMVDSSVGGKVGVDLAAGKNLAGAFHPPAAVWIPLETLATLPRRQFLAGAAEVWKAAFILDADLLATLERQPLAPGAGPLEEIVARCVALKAAIVEEDEFETTGARAVLNFGHTVGHAIERVSGYGPVLHGEAVAVGMAVEAVLGERLGVTEPGTAGRVRAGLASQGLPTTSPWLEKPEELIAAMGTDKKAQAGRLAFSLLETLGACKLVRDVDPDAVRSALRSP